LRIPRVSKSTNGHSKNGVTAPQGDATASGRPSSKKTDLEQPPRTRIPRHVAIIMDGNGRWAQERGLSRQKGHRSGAENIRRVIQAAGERGIATLTLYAFSTENWSRPRREVSALIRLIPRFLKTELKTLHENGVRLMHIGNLDALDPTIRQQVEQAIELTKDNTRMTVALAFSYGGRDEVVQAARRIIADGLRPEQVDEGTFAAYLYTAAIGDPDLVIRTAGEMRLSNFLLWQSAYAEFYSTPTYWPDFDERAIDAALDAFAQRDRRFGGVESATARTPSASR
jgi:undecaprenyl diphosphate synthase